MDLPNTILYREDQRFRGPWLALILISCSLFAIISGLILIVAQVIFHHSLGTKPMPDALAVLIGGIEILIGIALLWLFWKAVLQIEVTPRGLFVRFYPFQRKTRQIDLENVARIAAVTYRPFRDYGGWGLRRGMRSRCYNVSGEQGLRIDYTNGCHLLLGSQRAEELAALVQQICPKSP